MAALLPVTGARAADIAILSGDDSPPKMYLQDGQKRGILVEILEYAGRQMPHDTLHVDLYPWARAYMQSSAGQGGIIGLSWTPRRDELFDYSTPVFVDEVVIVVRKGHAFPYRTLEDLRGKTVGMLRGASFGEAFDQARADGVFTIEDDGGAHNRLSKLVAGRIDCALFNVGKAGFEETLRLQKIPRALRTTLAVLPVPLRRDPNYLAFPKSMQMEGWLMDFNRVIRQGYARGDIQKIISRNLNPDSDR